MKIRIVAVAVSAIAFAAMVLWQAFGWRQAALFLVGASAGVVLYHAAFGFTSAWRELITDRRGAGLRAQMLMLAATTLVFLPLIADGDVFGLPVRGSIAPLALSGVVGAFLFGIGMQLGGGCASGTLYTVGGGSVRMIATLLAFIAGSVAGAWNLPAWQDQPMLGSVSLLAEFGLAPALVISLSLFGGVAATSIWLERRSTSTSPASVPETHVRPFSARWLKGPWPLVAGALGLALVNIATLSLAGRPWGVTSAFALWGSKLLALTGIEVAAWPYWQPAARAQQLSGSILSDVTSVMNIGIMLGALSAAGLAGRFTPTWRVPVKSLLAAVLGGLLLGYGARLAYGCNIGAFFSGVSSSSMHGWLWFAAAFVGNIVGTRLRPLFLLA